LWSQIVAFCDDYNAGRDKAFERLDPSLRHIATRDEGAYGSVHMSLGFRLPPDVAPSALADDLGRLLGGSPQPSAPGQLSVRLTFSGAEVAFRAEKNTQLVRTCLASIRGQGGQPRFVVKTGTSDMNVVGPAWGCPICAYGPGDSALDHTPDERISLSEYWRSIEILKSALTALTGSTDGVTYDTR
jgi:LysW-gamma-L-lysine carboxypeptidase